MFATKEIIKKSLFNIPLRNFHKSNAFHKKISVREALQSAMVEEMHRDEKVFLIGEEVGAYGGAYKVSKGMFEIFGPRRIVDTPITEAGFAGIACGAGMYGVKPILEFMTFNFAMQAIDHVVNSAAKINYMSGGDISCPIVFRGPNGAASAVAAQHSQCYASWYGNIPGLVVLAPYDAEDARGLLKAAIRDPNPVVFLENELMYGVEFEVDDKVMDRDFVLPLGKAKVMREGKHVTITAFSRRVGMVLEAAEILAKEGIECEVINLRTIKPLDRGAIIKSIKKTNHLVSVEEGFPQHGVGSEILATVFESEAFDYLDAPAERITGYDIPLPYATNLEAMSLPTSQNVINAVKRVLMGAKLKP